MKHRVLLVDDERLIREGLRGLIPWEDYGFEVAAVAADGVEALEWVAQHPVDLVIADIRMPRMDGLEFLEALRARGNDARFLVLTGFAEFSYAQRAAAHRIDGYLLKPVEEEKLVAALADIGRQLEATQFSAAALVRGADRAPQAYDWGRWQVLWIEPLAADGTPRTLDPDEALGFRRACFEAGWGEAFFEPPLVGILLRQVYPGGKNLDRLARDLKKALGPRVPWFAAAVGDVVTDAASVAVSGRQALQRLQGRFFAAPSTLLWTSRAASETAPDPGPWGDRLALALETGRPGAAAAVLADLGAALAEAPDAAAAREVLRRAVAGAGADPARNPDLWRQPFLSSLVEALAQDLEARPATERPPVDASVLVKRLIEVIETRYSENLKLEVLADTFGYNSAYLGKLFRSKTGEYFNAYLDRVRIAKAQDLLRQGYKVYQVAEAVGYKYVDYFHAKFKKITGLSPSQFRDS